MKIESFLEKQGILKIPSSYEKTFYISFEDEFQVALIGDFEHFGLHQIISLIDEQKKSGVLCIELKEAKKAIFFQNGAIVFATTSIKDERLGESLIRAGKITQEQLDLAAKEITPQKKLGKILVERGLITPKDLWLGVRKQVEEVLSSLFREQQGAFIFIEGQPKLTNRIHIELKIPQIERKPKPKPAQHIPTGLKDQVEKLNGIFKEIFSNLSNKISPKKACLNLNTFFIGLSHGLEEIFKGISVNENGDIDLSKLWENVSTIKRKDLSELVLKGMKELLYFSIFETMNFASPEQADELLRMLRDMELEM